MERPDEPQTPNEAEPDELQEPEIQREIADSDEWMQKGLRDPEREDR